MTSTPDKPRRKVTLEQLLKVKRAERPEPAFWEAFDRDLRRRQLAALVTVSPLHERVAQAFMRFARRTAPVGAAAAALAAGVVVWDRSDRPPTAIYAAEIDPENRATSLPEERVGISLDMDTSRLLLSQQPVVCEIRPSNSVAELSLPRQSGGSFHTVASPYTVSASFVSEQAQVVRAVSAEVSPVRAEFLPAGGSF